MRITDSTIWTVLLSLALFSGCGDGHPKRGRVEGIIMVRGERLSKGQITFIPEKGRPATGVIQSDGTYRLTTYDDGDGALIGAHKVTVEAVDDVGGHSFSSFAQEVEASKSKRLPPTVGLVRPLVHESYNRAETTDLVANVKSGDNRIDFNLPKSPSPRSN